MIASAYCYHHRGQEPGFLRRFAPPNFTSMDFAEGVPVIAEIMLPIVEQMVNAYRANKGDVYHVRFEDLTRSSKDFDSSVARIFDFMFGAHISLAERHIIEKEAQAEDLHR